MKIEKEYNVQGLADKVKGCIKTVCETKSRNVSLDVITAQEIVDVLEIVASWENKSEESNNMSDEEIKGCCFGWHINGGKKCNLCVYEKDCMIETEERGEECFRKSYGKRPTIICKACKHAEHCEVLTKHE